MTVDDDLNRGKTYPAQKTLQMKAGKGEISEARIARAQTVIEEKKKPLLLHEVRRLIKPLPKAYIRARKNDRV